MKIEKRRTVVECDLFVADDGMEFETEKECTEYEQLCARQNAAVEKIEQCRDLEGRANCNGAENYEYYEYHWYRPQNKEEIAALNAVYGSVVDDSCIGKWLCIESEPHGDEHFCSMLDDGIAYVRNLLDAIGYDLTITPRA